MCEAIPSHPRQLTISWSVTLWVRVVVPEVDVPVTVRLYVPAGVPELAPLMGVEPPHAAVPIATASPNAASAA